MWNFGIGVAPEDAGQPWSRIGLQWKGDEEARNIAKALKHFVDKNKSRATRYQTEWVPVWSYAQHRA